MTSHAILLLLAGTTVICCGVGAQSNYAIPIRSAHAESRCPGNLSSFAFRLVDRDQIALAVSINHSGPYDFLLDTGTQITVVGPSLAAELHLDTFGAAEIRSVGFHGPASFTQLDLLEAGLHAVVNQRALVYPLLNVRAIDPRIRGILGEDFLQQFDMLIDYAHRLICFDESATMRAEVKGPHIALLIPTRTEDGAHLPELVVIAARLSGESRPVRLVLDSGANMSYLYNTSQHLVPQTTSPTSPAGASLTGSGLDGNRQVLSALPPQNVKFGSLEIPRVSFLTYACPQKNSRTSQFDGLLTMSLFRWVFITHAGQFAVLKPR
jgi:hypothetical protein